MAKRICSLLVVLLLVVLIGNGDQRAAKISKSGDKSASQGDYYTAAKSYLDALAKKPKSTKTVDKLRQVAQPAYDQKLKLAEQYQTGGNLEGALREYKELEQFVETLRRYNAANFMTIDFRNTLSSVGESAAELRYQNAEGLFSGRNFPRAIEEYRAALKLKSPYRDSYDKISESCYRMAADSEASNAYRRAAETYLQACETTPAYKDSMKKAAAIYKALGDHFSGIGEHRKAYEDYVKASRADSNYPDLASKMAQAKELATRRIAFVRIDNPTGNSIAGLALGDVIIEGIRSRVQSQASPFLATVDRAELMSIAQEQRLAERAFDFEASVPLKVKGIHYYVIGKLNQVRENRAGLTREKATCQYEFRYFVPYTDKNGKQDTRTEYRTETGTLDIFRDSVKLALGGAIRIIEANSGTTIINHQIQETGGDDVLYGDNLRFAGPRPLDQVTVDKETDQLMTSRKELADVGTLVDRMIDSIVTSVSNEILAGLDRVPYVSDPTTLKY